MSEGKKINDAAAVSGLPAGGFVLVADSGGGLKRLSVDALLADVRGAVKVGGRNLLLNSGTELTRQSYLMERYKLGGDKLKDGEPFVLTIWGTMAFQAFADGGTKMVGRSSGENGVYRVCGIWNKGDVKELWIYKLKNDDTSIQTISRIKLERGNVATDWTPAPEDYMPTNSTSGGVKESPLYALVVRPKGGVRHEQRGEGADKREAEGYYDGRLGRQRSCAGLGRAADTGDLLCQFLDDKHPSRNRRSRGLQSVMSSSDDRTSGGSRLVGTRDVLAGVVADEMGVMAQVYHEHYFVTTSPEGSATERSMAGKEVAYV